MNEVAYYKTHFEQLQRSKSSLNAFRQNAFDSFAKWGIPHAKHEEWKYTRVGSLFNIPYQFPAYDGKLSVAKADVGDLHLPGHENANELVFINGLYAPSYSKIISNDLVVIPLEEAAVNEYREIVAAHLGHSSNYLKDGINALNTAFVNGGVFVYFPKGKRSVHPVYVYHITDARTANIFAQPRSLVYVSPNAHAQLVETYVTLGVSESFTNQVIEIVVEEEADVEYYKIQNDAAHANQVSTTHIRQVGKSHVHTLAVSLNGGIVRNNLNIILEAEHCEAHLYGLYFQTGKSHIDNHTVVDNIRPHCFSNEFYKGIMADHSTGVFNGKILVKPQAQKTNAYQSNKNILLSDNASVNSKPQLEIFADDVKCSHGCTVGQLDEEALFYLRSRGISGKVAHALMVHAFASDILEHIKIDSIRDYVETLIENRLGV